MKRFISFLIMVLGLPSISIFAGITANYPILKRADFPETSPEWALANYLDGWKIRYWKKMLDYSQLTWKSKQTDPISVFESMYFNKKLLGARIVDREIIGNNAIKIHTIIYFSINSKIDSVKISPMVIREYAPYKPGINGYWGVNPLSTLKEENIAGNYYESKINYKSIINYKFQSKEDISYIIVSRYVYRVEIPADPNKPLPNDLLLPTAKYIWENNGRYLDEFTVYFYLPEKLLNQSLRSHPYAYYEFNKNGYINHEIQGYILENSPWYKK